MKALAQLGGTLLLVLVAGISGYLLAGGAPRPAPAPSGRVVPVAVPVPAGGVRLEDIRALVREEVASARAHPDEASAPAAPRDPEAEGRAAAVRSHFEAAIGAGVWTDADRRALIGELGAVAAEERQEILRRLAQAINDGSLRVATAGTPL